jgi:hypothetical protein
MKRAGFLTAFLLMVTAQLPAQVINNEIKNRLRLTPEVWLQSSTKKSAVEWDCINRELTSSCLIYHNDQWFTIHPSEKKAYYINIASQHCRDSRGIQAVILEGDPCKTQTYRLIRCIPFTEQADISIRLDSLEKGKEYLINIDGYLGDLCDFNIQFSERSKGIVLTPPQANKFETTLIPDGTALKIQWTIPDSLLSEIKRIFIYRKLSNGKLTLIDSVKMIRNAYGSAISAHAMTDSLTLPGGYSYYIHADDGNELTQVSMTSYEYRPEKKPRAHCRKEISFHAPRRSLVYVMVFNKNTQEHLLSTTRSVEEGVNKLWLDLGEYVQQGIKQFKIVVSNNDLKEDFLIDVE